MSAPELVALATEAVAAGDARLDGRMTREAHGAVLARIGARLDELGATWGELIAIGEKLPATHSEN